MLFAIINSMRYIGNKTQLLGEIEAVINENCKDVHTFCDIFSGTASVAKFFKPKYEIISNDILYLSYVIQRGTIQNDSVPSFDKLTKHLGMSPYQYFDIIENTDHGFKKEQMFFLNNYSELAGRTYLTNSNAELIDLIRLSVEKWFNEKLLTEDEYFYLLGSIVESIPFFSNISGTYGAFLKTWDPRALKRFTLIKPEVITNGKNNKCFNLNYLDLLDLVSGDVLYVDPPYNERQYLPNYHLLETAAKYDYPNIKGVTGIREYKEQKSDFCIKSKALSALELLVSKANFKYILFSYNTDGLMPEDEIKKVFQRYSKNGECKVYRIPYKRFKSRTLVNTSDLYELIFFIEKK